MALAAAVACPPPSWLCSGPGRTWLPLFQAARSVLARCSADALRPLQRLAGLGDALRQPSSGVPGPPELCKESSASKLCGVARLMTRCRGPNERQPPASHYARSRLTAMARLTAALCLSCASAMSYHNPVKAPQRTGTSFLPVKLQSGNSKETNKNSSHARIAREARSAPL